MTCISNNSPPSSPASTSSTVETRSRGNPTTHSNEHSTQGEQTYTHKCQLFIISFYSQLPTNLIRIFWAPIFHLLIHQKWREKQTSEILRTCGFRVYCLKLLFYLIVHRRQIIFFCCKTLVKKLWYINTLCDTYYCIFEISNDSYPINSIF